VLISLYLSNDAEVVFKVAVFDCEDVC